MAAAAFSEVISRAGWGHDDLKRLYQSVTASRANFNRAAYDAQKEPFTSRFNRGRAYFAAPALCRKKPALMVRGWLLESRQTFCLRLLLSLTLIGTRAGLSIETRLTLAQSVAGTLLIGVTP